MIYKMY